MNRTKPKIPSDHQISWMDSLYLRKDASNKTAIPAPMAITPEVP